MNHIDKVLQEVRQHLSKQQYQHHWRRTSQGAPRPTAMVSCQAHKPWLEKRFKDTAQPTAKNAFTCSNRSIESRCGTEHSTPNRRSQGLRKAERGAKAGGDPDGDSAHANSSALQSATSSEAAADTQHIRHDAVLWRLPQVLAHIPVSKSTWWAGVKDGRYPQPVKLSPRCTAWRASDIVALVQTLQSPQTGIRVSANGKSVSTLHDRSGLPATRHQGANSPDAGTVRPSFRKLL